MPPCQLLRDQGRIDGGTSARAVAKYGHVGDLDKLAVAAQKRERAVSPRIYPDDISLQTEGEFAIFRVFRIARERVRSPVAASGRVLAVRLHRSRALA
jgi:hypothetical protein